MRSHRITALALVALPTILVAQDRTSGGRTRAEAGADWKALTRESGPTITSSDLEKVNPIKFLADKKKDLKLSDDKAKELKDLAATSKETNKDLYTQLDSLRGVIKVLASAKAPEDQLRARIAREDLARVVQQVRARYDSSCAPVLAAFDESQRVAATGLLAKHWEEADETLREKLGGARAMPTGPAVQTETGRGGRRRP